MINVMYMQSMSLIILSNEVDTTQNLLRLLNLLLERMFAVLSGHGRNE